MSKHAGTRGLKTTYCTESIHMSTLNTIRCNFIPLRPIDRAARSITVHTLDVYCHIFSWGMLPYVIIKFCWWSRTCLHPVLTQRLAYISSLRVWVQMEEWNLIGYCKWPFSLQQTNCQALHMKKGLKMQLADVHVMSAMWVSGEWDPWITDVHKTRT